MADLLKANNCVILGSPRSKDEPRKKWGNKTGKGGKPIQHYQGNRHGGELELNFVKETLGASIDHVPQSDPS